MTHAEHVAAQQAKREAHREARESAHEAARETARRTKEDERGRDLLLFAGSGGGRAEFDEYRAKVLARRGAAGVQERIVRAGSGADLIQRSDTITSPPSEGAVESDFPFRVVDDSQSGVAKVRIVPGGVNNLMARVAGVANVPTTAGVWPVLAVSGSGFVYVRTTWSGSEPRTLGAADLFFAASVPANGDAEGFQLVAQVSYDTLTAKIIGIYQSVTHSLFVQRVKCGNVASYYWNAI